MSSGIGREDVRQELWLAGVKDQRMLNKLMRVIDAYVYHAARNVAADEITRALPEATTITRKRTYRCTGDCRQWKALEEFPERKQQNPSLPSVCSYCDERRVTMQDAGRGTYRSS